MEKVAPVDFIETVEEYVSACRKAGIPVEEAQNMDLFKAFLENRIEFYNSILSGSNKQAIEEINKEAQK
jgi:uncharacterized protein with von Willebrand factor type A (vWA) domain